MAKRAGRPPNLTRFDKATLIAVRTALLGIATELNLPRRRYADPTSSGRKTLQPEPLDLAALALEARDALELIACEHVEHARELDGLTWEQVGERFDISMQAAHSRFHRSS